MASQTKLLSIPVPASTFKRFERVAEQSGLTLDQLASKALRSYVESQRPKQGLAAALAATREDARRKGTDKLTMREINAEIAAARREAEMKRAKRAS